MAASALALVCTVLAQPAAAAHVSCGQTIAQSTVLDSDLLACERGLLIRGSNITLDLNGHIVSGLRQSGEGPGITIEDGTGVVVRGPGRVAQFDAGLYIVGGSGKHRAERRGRGEQPAPPACLRGRHPARRLRQQRDPQQRRAPQRALRRIGLINGASFNTISGNAVEGNNIGVVNASGVVVRQEDHGIRIEAPGSTNNTVSNNQVRGNGLDGISVFRANPANNDNVITGNVVQANGIHNLAQRRGNGIVVFGGNPSLVNPLRTVISGNFVFGNAANGIRVESQQTQILNNRTGNNAQAALGEAYDLNDTNPSCDANTWRGNTYHTAFPACTTQ